MNKKSVSLVLCVVVISAGTFAFSGNTPANLPKPTKQQSPTITTPATAQIPRSASAPEHVVYRQLFRHLVALKERAREIERQGKDGRALRSHYKDKAGLNDEQARILDGIAADCEREVAQMDAKAQKIIDAFKARFPGGKVPVGEKPPPPPELHRMQQGRNMIIMHARERLRTALGAQGFQQLDDFVKLNVAPKVKPAQLQPQQPASTQQGAGQ